MKLLLAVPLCLLLSASARAEPQTSVATAAAPPDLPLMVQVSISNPKDKGVLISGDMALEAHHETEVEDELIHTTQDLKADLWASSEPDGTVSVKIRYSEIDSSGHSIKWSPGLHGKRGATLTASMTIGGVTREARCVVH